MFIVTSALSDDGRTRTYKISGEIFFASAERFADAFDFKDVLDHVVIDLTDAHFWDITGVGTLDKTVIRFRREGTAVEVVGLNEASAAMVKRFAVHDKPDAEKLLAAH
jgi:SulP family sulfate permease